MKFTIKHNHPGKTFTRTARTPDGVASKFSFHAGLWTEVPKSLVPSLSKDINEGHLYVALVNDNDINAKPDYHATNRLIEDITSGAYVKSLVKPVAAPKATKGKSTAKKPRSTRKAPVASDDKAAE